jgi:hypothetical protein
VTVEVYRRCHLRRLEDFHELKLFTCMVRAILAAAISLTVTLAAVSLASAEDGAGDQEKGSTGWSGGSKDQPSQSTETLPRGNSHAIRVCEQRLRDVVCSIGTELRGA